MNDTSMLDQINSLRRMTVGELRARWRELYGCDSRSRNKDFLWRRLAWRVQELALGGLSDATRGRLAELGAEPFSRPLVPREFAASLKTFEGPRRDIRLPKPGSTLLRRYKSRDIRVTVLDDGFEWDGRRFDSLSEVAFAITGSRWNGLLFFGLTKRKRSR